MNRNGYTSVDGESPHTHSYQIDEFGNGKTLETLSKTSPPHTHLISNKKMSKGGADNHSHKLMAGKFGSSETEA